jgi:hypothetical protein
MKGIRITLRSKDFAAVSQSMIALGVSFQVEPVADEPATVEGPVAAPARREAKRKPARTGRRRGVSKSDREPSGAARLRAMVERNRLASARPGDDTGETAGDDAGPSDPGTEPPGFERLT